MKNSFDEKILDEASDWLSSKGLNSDIHASAEYRAHIIKAMVRKAISSC